MKRLFITSFAILLTAICSIARQPERGYRGFVELTGLINHHPDIFGHERTYFNPGIATSHGYQFNSWLFVGAGIDFSLTDNGIGKYHPYALDNNDLKLFGQVRSDFLFGKFTPFADIRLGYITDENGSVYFSPSIGYRFNWGRKIGVNIGVGYTLDNYRYEDYIPGTTPEGLNIAVPTGKYSHHNTSSFSFRVGIDF